MGVTVAVLLAAESQSVIPSISIASI